MLRAVALIPARSKSIRSKDKNIRLVNEHPLLAYTIRAAIDSNQFKKIYCITDSKLYKEIALYYGADELALRPQNTATKLSPDIKWLNWLNNEINLLENFDIFSILRPTSPLRTAATIKRAFKEFLSGNKYDSLRAIQVCKEHPGKMWVLKKEGMQPFIDKKINNVPWHSSQYQSLPEIFVQNASLEISTVSSFLKYKSISGKKISPFITKGYEGFDINYDSDFDLLDIILQKNNAVLPRINKSPFTI